MLETIRSWWESGKALWARFGWFGRTVSGAATFVGIVWGFIAADGWGITMILLGALLSVTQFDSWKYAVGWGLLFWALYTIAQVARRRADYYVAMTPKGPVQGEPPPPALPPFKTIYSDDEITSEVLPALFRLDQIFDRRCLRAVAIWEKLEDTYWDKPHAIDLLRGDEAVEAVGQLEKSRNLITNAHTELFDAVRGHYERDLLPLIDIPGTILKDADSTLEGFVARLREFAKPTSDGVDRMPFFKEDGRKLRLLRSQYGGWARERRLVIQSNMAAYRDVLQQRHPEQN